MRVYELAKMLGMNSNELIRRLNKHDIDVQTPVAGLTDEQVQLFLHEHKNPVRTVQNNLRRVLAFKPASLPVKSTALAIKNVFRISFAIILTISKFAYKIGCVTGVFFLLCIGLQVLISIVILYQMIKFILTDKTTYR